jgi:D-alanyl-D-alanine-carboxypeptidase/D-alanyl-D-alanine-endopeptidase
MKGRDIFVQVQCSSMAIVIAAMLVIGVTPSLASETESDFFAELDLLMAKSRLDIKAPALVYGVVANGQLAHSGGFGLRSLPAGPAPDNQTAFRIASMTKMMTGLLILDLKDQGKLYLDAPAETYFSALAKLGYPTTDSRKITVRDLLNHTAGFVTDDPWADRQMARTPAELDAFLVTAEPFTYAPGESFEYSNLGYAILGRIIENVSGRDFAEQLQARLLQPLGMTNTTLDFKKLSVAQRAGAYNWVNGQYLEEPILASGAFDPLGGIWTTVDDYAKFVAWILSAWPARNDPESTPIPRRVVRSFTDGVYLLNASKGPGLNGEDDCIMSSAYSAGLSIKKHCDAGLLLSHGGGFPGYGSYVLMLPDRGVGVFGFANETYADVYGPVWDAARLLMTSNLTKSTPSHVADSRLQMAYEGVQAAYASGKIEAGDLTFADNFFLDRSEQRWNKQLDQIRREAGECVPAALEPQGRLSGEFEWQCESARVAGYLVQSPLNPANIQKLHLRVKRRNGAGRDLVIDADFH